MSTRDTQMNQYLTTIAEAVHGRDMRSAIHDGLEKTYNDAYTWFNESLGNANQALQKATEALDIAEPMGDDIQEIKDLAEDLDTRYDETNERVNNIIAHNQDTQGNSELIDLRTTYDGQIKTSAGTAVRSQISNLHSRINNLVREQSTGELEDCHAKPVYVPLYENQYPSSAFAAQTLQLSLPGSPAPSLAKYAFIKITFKDSNLFGAGVRSVYIPNPGKDAEATNIYTSDGHVTMPADGTYGINSYSRKFTAALSSNDTVLNIMFTDCEKIATDNPFAIDNSDMTISDPSSTTTTDNEYLIPYEVFLIDYVLDGEIEIDKDTELIDIRNGEDGTTYQSAGAAVRGQIVSAKNKTASTQSMIAPLYSVSGTYAAGDYVNYGDKLYKAKQSISSEAWTASHWQEVNVMDEVDSNVGELKSTLSDVQSDVNVINGRFVFDLPPVNILEGETFTTHEGGYWNTNGTFEATSNYDSYNELVDVTEGITYTIAEFRGYVVAYDANGTNGVNLIHGSDVTVADKPFTIPSGKSKIGISWRNSRPAPTSITRPTNIQETANEDFTMPHLQLELSDISDFDEYKASVDEKLDLIEYDTSSFVSPNIIEGETFTYDVGSLWTSGGTRSHTEDATNYTSLIELIPVVSGCRYVIIGFRGQVWLYDENGQNGQKRATTATVNFEFTCPEGCVQMGISYNHTKVDAPTEIYRLTVIPSDYATMKVKIPRLATNGLYKYKGKTIVCFGDSITGNYVAPFDYPTRLSKLLGVDAVNVGFGGTQMSSSSSAAVDAFCMYRLVYSAMNNDFTIQDEAIETSTIANAAEHLDNLEGIDWDDVFAVTIEYGTNDIGHSAVLDNENNEFDTDTFLGALRYTIKTFQEAHPELQILVITPMYRFAGSWSEDCNHRTFTDKNGVTHTFNNYIDGMIGVCRYYGIPVLDTFRTSNINEYTYQYYLKDGTHPVDTVGQEHIASLFENAIRNAF